METHTASTGALSGTTIIISYTPDPATYKLLNTLFSKFSKTTPQGREVVRKLLNKAKLARKRPARQSKRKKRKA